MEQHQKLYSSRMVPGHFEKRSNRLANMEQWINLNSSVKWLSMKRGQKEAQTSPSLSGLRQDSRPIMSRNGRQISWRKGISFGIVYKGEEGRSSCDFLCVECQLDKLEFPQYHPHFVVIVICST